MIDGARGDLRAPWCFTVLGLVGAFAAFAFSAWADDLPDLAKFTSRNGELAVTLTAAPTTAYLAGVQVSAYAFNGAYAGPVLDVAPGDHVRIHLVNQIDQPINLHFHGSHMSPLGRADNMYVMVNPGGSYDYDFKVPLTQPPGLYWYHTHVHGIAEDEINRGLSGAMIVRGIERCVPQTSTITQRLMVLKTYTTDSRDQEALKALHGIVQTINGAAPVRFTMAANTPEFWRISNQSPNDYYHLRVANFHFEIVGQDGAPTHGRRNVEAIDIPPAGTMEVIVSPPGPGSYGLTSASTPTGLGRAMKVTRELGTIEVAASETSLNSSTPPVADRECTSDLSKARLTGVRSVTYSQKPGEEIYFIDGKVFDHKRTDVRVRLGSVEDWTIRNDTDDMHTFHIHQVHFQIMAINGQAQPFAGLVDVVRVPERGSVTVRIPFTDPTIVGRFMFHCHVLKHEDRGMMATVEVYDPKRPRLKAPAMAGMN